MAGKELDPMEEVALLEDPSWANQDSKDPFYTYLHRWEDVKSWKDFFAKVQRNCDWCEKNSQIAGLGFYCEKWKCEITDEMRKSTDCPDWLFNTDQDIPF